MSAPITDVNSVVVQEGDTLRTVVLLRRELKRKTNALRKLENKMKSMIQNEADYIAATREYETLKTEISKLEMDIGASLGPEGGEIKGTTPVTKLTDKSTGIQGEVQSNNNANTLDKSRNKDVDTKVNVNRLKVTTEAQAADTLMSDADLHEKLTELVRINIERDRQVPLFPSMPFQPSQDSALVHYQVAELALMMESMLIVGGNARTFAMIEAFKSLLQSTPVLSGPSLRKINPQDFEHLINVNFEYLRRSREPSAGMTYVKEGLVRRFVRKLTIRDETRNDFQEDERFSTVRSNEHEGSTEASRTSVDSQPEGSSSGDIPREVALNVLAFYERELKLSIESILEERSLPFLSSNDTILVFGRSSTVELILLLAAKNSELTVKPKVIVVDSAPLYEGRALAKRLTCSGLSVTYGLITTCCTLMPRCTRVFIGASAVLQNGDVLNRCGTALVVASAKQYRKPVLCFSGSFKFLPEVWLGNLGQNTRCIDVRQPSQGEHRIYSPGGWNSSGSQGRDVDRRQSDRGREFSGMRSDNIFAFGYLYDITPAAYVDMIICEMGCLHTSAIVAALRDREDKDEYSDMWEARCDVGE